MRAGQRGAQVILITAVFNRQFVPNLIFNVCLFFAIERERDGVNGGGAERDRHTQRESEAGSRL